MVLEHQDHVCRQTVLGSQIQLQGQLVQVCGADSSLTFLSTWQGRAEQAVLGRFTHYPFHPLPRPVNCLFKPRFLGESFIGSGGSGVPPWEDRSGASRVSRGRRMCCELGRCC